MMVRGKILSVVFLLISISTFFVHDAWGKKSKPPTKKGKAKNKAKGASNPKAGKKDEEKKIVEEVIEIPINAADEIPVNVDNFVSSNVIPDIEKKNKDKLEDDIKKIGCSVVKTMDEFESKKSSKFSSGKIHRFAKQFADQVSKKIASLDEKKDKYVKFFRREVVFNCDWDEKKQKKIIGKKGTRTIGNLYFLNNALVEIQWTGTKIDMTFQEWVDVFIGCAESNGLISSKFDSFKDNFISVKGSIKVLESKIESLSEISLDDIQNLLSQIEKANAKIPVQKNILSGIVAKVIKIASPSISVDDLIKEIKGQIKGYASTSENLGKIVDALLEKKDVKCTSLTSIIDILKAVDNRDIAVFVGDIVKKSKDLKDVSSEQFEKFVDNINELAGSINQRLSTAEKIKQDLSKVRSDLFIDLSKRVTEFKELDESGKNLVEKVWNGADGLLDDKGPQGLSDEERKKLLSSKKNIAEKYVPILGDRLKRAAEEGDSDTVNDIAGKLNGFLRIPDIDSDVKSQIGTLVKDALENSDDPGFLFKDFDFSEFEMLKAKKEAIPNDPLSIKLRILRSKLKQLKVRVAELAKGLGDVAKKLAPLNKKLGELKAEVE